MSRIEEQNKVFRENLLKKNEYSSNDEYQAGHENALSTGDEKGKGLNNNEVGSLTDITTRKNLLAKNKYSTNNEYNASNA